MTQKLQQSQQAQPIANMERGWQDNSFRAASQHI